MRIRAIFVDDELWSVEQFENGCRNTNIELVGKFSSSLDALTFVGNHEIEFALLDVKMPDMDGIALGRRLKEIKQDMIIVYVSGYEEYLRDAILGVKADYFVLKPYSPKDVVDVISRAKYLSNRMRKRVSVRTFGEFDLFIDGELVEFSNQKAKELLAICIDNGGGEVTMKRAIDILWEDRSYDNRVKGLYRKAIAYLNMIFRKYDLEYVFCNNRGSCHVNRQEIECDYYEILDGKSINETLFDGRYMMNYSWAEETCGKLCHMAAAYLE